jgi:hypothetical protein
MNPKFNKYLDYFPVPLDESKLIQLTPDGKNPAGKWDKHSPDWIPFVSPTAIQCNYYEHLDMFLCCLDWDYKSKFDNPIWKDFEYTETLVRESKNGLHAFYLSPEACRFKEKKTRNGGLDIDLKMATAHDPYSNGGYVKYHSQYTDNGLECLEIDINQVIASLYEQNNVPLEEQGSYSGSRKPISEEYVMNDYTEALAQYIYYYISNDNELFKDGFNEAWTLGLKLGGYLKSSEEARGFAIQLMQLATVYDKPSAFIGNFLRGWSASDNIKYNNFGKLSPKNDLILNAIAKKKYSIPELAKKMSKFDLHSYLLVAGFNY